MEGRFKQEGIPTVTSYTCRGYLHVYLRLTYVDVWQKPTQHCKAIVLQLKVKIFFKSAKKKRKKNLPPDAGDMGLIPGPSRLQAACRD